jgi:hypothetical protein
MLAAFRARRWDEARTLLDGPARYESFGLVGVHALYARRIAAFAIAPPRDDWDGVTVAMEK